MTYTAKDPHPPLCFPYLRETKSWLCGEEGEEEEEEGDNVHLKTHATARGMGNNTITNYLHGQWSLHYRDATARLV